MNITINYKEVELEVDYDYSPEEAAVYYPTDEAYPGCSEEATIDQIKIGGIDVTELLEDQFSDIEEAILEERNN